MKIRFTAHALERMEQGSISAEMVLETIEKPEGRIYDESAKYIYQRRFIHPEGKPFLLRVVIDEAQNPPSVVTVYAASRYHRYMR